MRIGFDARMITHPGIGRYIRGLLRGIIPLLGENELVLFGDKGRLLDSSVAAPRHKFICKTRFSKICNGATLPQNDSDALRPQNDSDALRPQNDRGVEIVQWDAPIYSFQEQMSWPFGRYGLDVVHIPHFNMPGLIGKGRGKGKERIVITIHDLIYTKFPQYLPLIKRTFAGPLIRNAINRSDRIIAVSDNTKKDIIDISDCASEKTSVIYEPVDAGFRQIDDKGVLGRVREKYKLDKHFILFVGSLKHHKNIKRLIDAYKLLKDKGIKHELVILGRYHPREGDILSCIKSEGARYIGEVPGQDVPAIYNMAKLFVMPSLYEGLGLPVLEAMACGVPVCSSNAASLPEVVGDAGMMFNPLDINDMADKMERVLSDEGLRRDLIAKGLKRVKEFSWEKAAKETLRVYERAVGMDV
jgi:glycosyltransferase involved in cell wall biosynthesis